jgi:hypothetical protein
MPRAVREFPGTFVTKRTATPTGPHRQRHSQKSRQQLTVPARTGYRPEDRDRVVVDLAQQAAYARRRPGLVIAVKAQVTVAPVQRPCPDGLGVAEPGDGKPHPTAAGARAPRRPALEDPQVPGARYRIPPGPGRGHRLGRAARTSGGRRRCRVRVQTGIWPVFQAVADSGGAAGPVPAQTCWQTTAALTQPPRTRARTSVASWHNALERTLPVPQAELTEPAGADPAAGLPVGQTATARCPGHWARCGHTARRPAAGKDGHGLGSTTGTDPRPSLTVPSLVSRSPRARPADQAGRRHRSCASPSAQSVPSAHSCR